MTPDRATIIRLAKEVISDEQRNMDVTYLMVSIMAKADARRKA